MKRFSKIIAILVLIFNVLQVILEIKIIIEDGAPMGFGYWVIYYFFPLHFSIISSILALKTEKIGYFLLNMVFLVLYIWFLGLQIVF